MAKTQDIKRRIRSIGNTMQLTRAMKMVSAAKLRRAQDRILSARPYAHRTLNVLRSLAARANPELHPLLQVHGDKRIEIVVVTADKGLCGAFNSHIIRTAETFADEMGGRELSVAAGRADRVSALSALGARSTMLSPSRPSGRTRRAMLKRQASAETTPGICNASRSICWTR